MYIQKNQGRGIYDINRNPPTKENIRIYEDSRIGRIGNRLLLVGVILFTVFLYFAVFAAAFLIFVVFQIMFFVAVSYVREGYISEEQAVRLGRMSYDSVLVSRYLNKIGDRGVKPTELRLLEDFYCDGRR